MMSSPFAQQAAVAYQGAVAASANVVNMLDQFSIGLAGYDQVAPAWLRYRVQGTPDLRTYIEAGRLSRQSIETMLHAESMRLGDFPRVLDFGCGCGRTLRWMRDLVPTSQFRGVDVDGEAIDWCRKHLPHASFDHTDFAPPLPFADASFDFIYTLSVFTHLPMAAQFAWLEELKRVLAPGGMIYLTVLGYSRGKMSVRPRRAPAKVLGRRVMASADLDMWGFLEAAEVDELEMRGFAFIPYGQSAAARNYGIAYHHPDFVMDRFSQTLTIRRYSECGFVNYLDAVLLTKETANVPSS